MSLICRCARLAASKVGTSSARSIGGDVRHFSHLVKGSASSAAVVLTRNNLTNHRTAHTDTDEADKEFIQYLTNEIKISSKDIPKGLPSFPGFEVRASGSEVVLTKESCGERVTVTFNVNHSVDADYDVQEQVEAEQSDRAPPMVSRPNFTVEVSKGDETLAVNCVFVVPDEEEGLSPDGASKEDEEYPEDLFNLEDISMYSSKQGLDNTVFSMSAEVMDGEMYDRLMDYLADRGVNEGFANNLTQFSSGYEGQQYLSLLERMKKFIAI